MPCIEWISISKKKSWKEASCSSPSIPWFKIQTRTKLKKSLKNFWSITMLRRKTSNEREWSYPVVFSLNFELISLCFYRDWLFTWLQFSCCATNWQILILNESILLKFYWNFIQSSTEAYSKPSNCWKLNFLRL